jgi:hypothetical protein
MDQPLTKAYQQLEGDIKAALGEHSGNQSVISVALNTLLADPDWPIDLETYWDANSTWRRAERGPSPGAGLSVLLYVDRASSHQVTQELRGQ